MTERPEQILKSYPFMLGHKEILLEGDVDWVLTEGWYDGIWGEEC